MGIVSWDNYPRYDTPWSYTALRNDLMRGLKDAPFMLMAVSYTHLDVYKRQLIVLPAGQFQCIPPVSALWNPSRISELGRC